jgi:chromosome segregation ATPase
LFALQDKEAEYRDKLLSIQTEKSQFEHRLQEANRALSLADSHLKQEIEKIKISLEQEYNRRYDRDQKQHQQEMQQLRQQLTNEFEKQRTVMPVMQSSTSAQDIEEVKKMYRTEIDRLYRENIELNQNQAKIIDTHQKQMQIMKKDLDDGYNNVINEFQHEQTRLQARCEQLKQQLNDTEQTIEQLKKTHLEDISKMKEKTTLEQDNRNRQENLQNRLDHLVKLLEQSNDA